VNTPADDVGISLHGYFDVLQAARLHHLEAHPLDRHNDPMNRRAIMGNHEADPSHRHLQAKDLMTSEVVTAVPDMPTREIARLLSRHGPSI